MSSDQYKTSLDYGATLSETLAGDNAYVQCWIMEEEMRISLRCREDDRQAVSEQLGTTLPEKVNTSFISENVTAFCLGPDEWLLIAAMSVRDDLFNKLKAAATAQPMSYTDVSQRNLAIGISGPEAEELIAIGCPQDLSISMFPVGKCTRTIFENAEIMLFRESKNTFRLETWRSFAPYIIGFFEKYIKEEK